MGCPRYCSVTSASQTILWHIGMTISATGKTKVGGNANFAHIRKVRFAGWIWKAQAPNDQRLALINMTNTEPIWTAAKTASLADLTHGVPTQKTVYYCPKKTNTEHTARPTASCSTPARDTSSSSVSVTLPAESFLEDTTNQLWHYVTDFVHFFFSCSTLQCKLLHQVSALHHGNFFFK